MDELNWLNHAWVKCQFDDKSYSCMINWCHDILSTCLFAKRHKIVSLCGVRKLEAERMGVGNWDIEVFFIFYHRFRIVRPKCNRKNFKIIIKKEKNYEIID